MGNINTSTWDLYGSGDLEFEDTPKDGGSSFRAVSDQEKTHIFDAQNSTLVTSDKPITESMHSDAMPGSDNTSEGQSADQSTLEDSNNPLPPKSNKPDSSKHSWKKPLLVAVIILLLLGLVTAFALYRNSVSKYNNLKSAQSALQQELLKSEKANAEELKALGDKVSVIRGELDKDIPEDLQAQYQDLLIQINSLTQSSNQAVASSAQDLLAKLTNQAGAGISLSPDGKTITNSGVLSVNNQTGNLSIQGTANQTNVTQNGATTTIGTVQDIAQTSSPTFNNQTLTGNGNIQGGMTVGGTTTTNNLTIQSSGTQNGYALCDASNNCGYSGAGSSYVQGGNSFGNPAYLGTNDNNSLNLETNGTTRLTIDTAGNTGLTGNLTTPGSVSASSLSGNGSGVTNVDATALNGNTAGNNSGQIALNNGTINSNLNSDLLDGQHGSYYQNAGNINAGTLSDARLSSNVTLQGNSFNGINQLVQLNGSGYLPSLNGSLVTNVDALTLQGNSASYFTNASNIASGTLSDLRLSSNVPLKNATNTFTGTNNFAGITATGILQGGYSVCDASNNCNYAPVSGSGNYIHNGTALQTANFYIQSASGSSVVAIVRGTVGQSANLQEWKNDSGLTVTRVNNSGDLMVNGVLSSRTSVMYIIPGGTGGTMRIHNGSQYVLQMDDNANNPALRVMGRTNSLSTTTLLVQGASGQTGDLQQWQNSSGTVLSVVTADGRMGIGAAPGTNVALNMYKSADQHQYVNQTLNVSPGGQSYQNYYTFRKTYSDNSAVNAAILGGLRAVGYNGSAEYDAGLIRFDSGTSAGRGDIYISTADGSVLQRAMTINYNGNVGIGVSVPASTARLGVINSVASTKGIVIQGAISQTANLQEWQDSTGAVLSSLTASGRLGLGVAPSHKLHVVDNIGSANDTWVARFTNTSSALSSDGVLIESAATTDVSNPLLVQRTDGTKYFAIQSNGFVNVGNVALGANIAKLAVVGDIGNYPALVVRGAVSQSADLQQWQNSTGTVLAALQNTGNLTLTQDNANLNVGTSQKGYVAIGAQGDYSGNFANKGAMCIDTACIQGDGGGGLTSTNSAGTLGTGFVRSGGVYGNAFGSFGNRVAIMNTLEVLSNTKAHAGFNITPVTGVAALFGTSSTSNVNIASRATSGQTADLLQAQDSTGTVLAKINVNGDLTVKNVSIEGAYITFSNNIRGYNVSVTASATSQTVNFGTAHPDANYAVFCTPDWNTSCYVSNKTVNGFTLNYGTAAPAAQQVDWFVAR